MGDHNSIIKSAAHEYKVALYYGHWEALAWIRLTHGNDCHVIVIVVHGTSQTVSRQPPYTNTLIFIYAFILKENDLTFTQVKQPFRLNLWFNLDTFKTLPSFIPVGLKSLWIAFIYFHNHMIFKNFPIWRKLSLGFAIALW